MTMTALTTRQLLGVKKQLPKFTPLFVQMFFPQVAEFDTEEIAFDKVVDDVQLAPFVAPMVAGKANRKKGGNLHTFRPAYVKPTDNVTGGQLIKRMPGEAMGGELSPEDRRLATIASLLDKQEKSITYREEWMAVQAVLTGQVVVEGEDYETQVVDYGRSPQNNITLAGAAKWDTVDVATYDPTDDLEEWAEKSSGIVGRYIFDKYAWRKFSKFAAVKEKLDNRRGTSGSLELGPTLQKEVQFKGWFGEVEIWVYTGKYKDTDGTQKPFMPANTLVLAPMATDNAMAYGAIQDVKANANGIARARRYPSNWFTDNPSVEWLQTQSAPLPVDVDSDQFVVVAVA